MSGLNRHGAPRSVEAITKDAQQYPYEPAIAPKYWLRTAKTLLKQAEIYEREGNIEQTYLVLFRHAHLVLAHLAVHPDIKDESVRSQFAEAKQEVNKDFEKLDALKPRIARRYDEYSQQEKDRQARRTIAKQQRESQEGHNVYQNESPTYLQTHLHGHEDKAFAVQLANEEISRRTKLRKRSSTETEDLGQSMQTVRNRLEKRRDEKAVEPDESAQLRTDAVNYRYPTMPPRHVQESGSVALVGDKRLDSTEGISSIVRPPMLPPKPPQHINAPTPPRPRKVVDSVEAKTADAPSKHFFALTAQLEDGTPLRTLFLPRTLRTTFIRIAHQNTRSNLETCAFLAGTLISNALFVNKLIVPAQVATSDTCEMTNESQLFDYVDSEPDLMVLGWIHTHPSQTCFMSSRDLHTHAGYQMMLAESIAIVCAPSKGDTMHGGDWGAFRLTDPPGKKTVLACHKPGIFHPHDVDHIYTDALRPGHVAEVEGLDFDVVDLR